MRILMVLRPAFATEGAHQGVYAGGQDLFLARFSPGGRLVWGTYFGRQGQEAPGGLATADAAGEGPPGVVLVGRAVNWGLTTANALRIELYGTADAIIAKFTPEGALRWATHYGGNSVDNASRVSATPDGRIYVAGATMSTELIATSDGYQTKPGSPDSYIVAQFMDEAQAVGCRVAGPLPAGLSLLLGGLIAMKRRRRFR